MAGSTYRPFLDGLTTACRPLLLRSIAAGPHKCLALLTTALGTHPKRSSTVRVLLLCCSLEHRHATPARPLVRRQEEENMIKNNKKKSTCTEVLLPLNTSRLCHTTQNAVSHIVWWRKSKTLSHELKAGSRHASHSSRYSSYSEGPAEDRAGAAWLVVGLSSRQ